MSNLSTIISNGLNNPDCAFYTGQMFGQLTLFRVLIIFYGLNIIYKFVDTLAVQPMIDKLKSKLKINKTPPKTH